MNSGKMTLIAAISSFFTIIAGICFLIGLATAPPMTPEETWVWQNNRRCESMTGKANYNSTQKVYECWRTTWFSKTPKLLFTETYTTLLKNR